MGGWWFGIVGGWVGGGGMRLGGFDCGWVGMGLVVWDCGWVGGGGGEFGWVGRWDNGGWWG